MAIYNGTGAANTYLGDITDDSIYGNNGNDTLYGGGGHDYIDGGSQNDLLFGDAGNDTLLGANGLDVLNGGDGNDNLSGGNGNDTLNGGNDDDSLSGDANNDLLSGDAGNDTLLGGGAADTLIGGEGNDSLNGGAGIDTASFAGLSGYVNVDLTAGTAVNYSQWGVLQGSDALAGIENVVGTAMIDTIKGTNGNNLLAGGDGNDQFIITAGNDTIQGDAGSDSLLFSGMGAATVNLTTGTYSVNANSFGSIISVDHAAGGAFNDNITGNANRNVLEGGAGNDTITSAQGGDDYLMGGAGSDRLISAGGTVTMDGDDNYLSNGTDTASDIFEIGAVAGNVTIWDFDFGNDKLDLTAFGFDANGVSAYWTGSAVYNSTNSVFTLTGQGNEVVNITLNGAQGNEFAATDMINGSGSLLPPPPLYPNNGGNGVADIFTVTAQNGVNLVFDHFENGLDKIDISGVDFNYWGGYLANVPGSNDAVLEFYGTNSEYFTVTLPGMPYYNIDDTDFIM